jgi:hypothetical protein
VCVLDSGLGEELLRSVREQIGLHRPENTVPRLTWPNLVVPNELPH